MGSVRFDEDVKLSEAEARLILEQKTDRFWGQGNVMLRHANEDGEKGELLAYSWNLSTALADDFWLGIEGSGQPISPVPRSPMNGNRPRTPKSNSDWHGSAGLVTKARATRSGCSSRPNSETTDNRIRKALRDMECEMKIRW